jgi:hypothetical protein
MSPKSTLSTLLLLALQSTIAPALDPSCAPGGNFDLSYWSLQLPSGTPGNPTVVSSSSLKGCKGYQNDEYFFTESGDGALVMKVPGSPSSSGCVTTTNSKHCRTELREVDPGTGDAISWSPSAPKNGLSATLLVPKPDDSEYGTVIGQIHIDDTVSSKPVCELYYNGAGDIHMGVEQTRSGGNEVVTKVGSVPVGKNFTYEIRYEEDTLSVSINGGAPQTLDTYQLDSPKSYFKAGNYNQGNSASDVHFFAITVDHGEDAKAELGQPSINQPEMPLADLNG